MATIRVTPEELNTQGQQLNNFADNLREVLNSIDAKILEIIEGWDGLAQDAYYTMYQTLQENLKQFPELVDSLGQATIAAAETFSSVDEQLQGSFTI